jgi:hypothetical protein
MDNGLIVHLEINYTKKGLILVVQVDFYMRE